MKQEKNYLKEEIADMLDEDVSTIENIMSELQEWKSQIFNQQNRLLKVNDTQLYLSYT